MAGKRDANLDSQAQNWIEQITGEVSDIHMIVITFTYNVYLCKPHTSFLMIIYVRIFRQL